MLCALGAFKIEMKAHEYAGRHGRHYHSGYRSFGRVRTVRELGPKLRLMRSLPRVSRMLAEIYTLRKRRSQLSHCGDTIGSHYILEARIVNP
jgi:hypothetical protein